MSKRRLALGLLLATLTLAPRARADASPDEQAAALNADAEKLAAAKRWAEACPKLEASEQIDPQIGTMIRLGACYEALGRTASAWSAYREAASAAKRTGDDHDREEARQAAKRLFPTLPKLLLDVPTADREAGLAITLDGTAVSASTWGTAVPIDPGDHVIEATKPGSKKKSLLLKITIEPKPVVVTVPVSIARHGIQAPDAAAPVAPAPYWKAQRIGGAAVAGAGLVGVIVGSVFGGITLSKASQSKSHCTANLSTCDATGLQLQEDAHTTATDANLTFVPGALLLIAGVITFATTPSAAPVPGFARVTLAPVAGAQMTGLAISGGW